MNDNQFNALKRLETWAEQDPTGPIESEGVANWVRSQIGIALGRNDVSTPIHLQPRLISLMEIELIELRNEVERLSGGAWVSKCAVRTTPQE